MDLEIEINGVESNKKDSLIFYFECLSKMLNKFLRHMLWILLACMRMVISILFFEFVSKLLLFDYFFNNSLSFGYRV